MRKKKRAYAFPLITEGEDLAKKEAVIAYVERVSQDMTAHESFEPDPRIIEEALRFAGSVPRKRAGTPTAGYVGVALDVWRKLEGTRFPWEKGVSEETLLLWGKYLGNVYATFLALRAGVGKA